MNFGFLLLALPIRKRAKQRALLLGHPPGVLLGSRERSLVAFLRKRAQSNDYDRSREEAARSAAQERAQEVHSLAFTLNKWASTN